MVHWSWARRAVGIAVVQHLLLSLQLWMTRSPLCLKRLYEEFLKLLWSFKIKVDEIRDMFALFALFALAL